MDHCSNNVVAKQPQKIKPLFCSRFYIKTYIKRILKTQKNVICIFGSGHSWVKLVLQKYMLCFKDAFFTMCEDSPLKTTKKVEKVQQTLLYST